MAVESATLPSRPSPLNDPRVRAVIFQVVTIVSVLAFGVWIVNNTLANLERQGIASGFDFMSTQAGFGITWSLIDYSESYSTYGDAFIVGLLNTIFLSGIGVVCATILGFILGIARLSKNWLISRLATVYIEVIRNVPLLLQIFFWYFAVLRALPAPRQSLVAFDAFFINNRGFFVPRALPEPLFWATAIACGLGIVATIVLARFSKKRQEETGQRLPVLWPGLGMIIGLPIVVLLITGVPFSWEYPELKGFNFVGGVSLIPEFAAMLLALSIYTATFIGEIVRSGIQAVSYGQTEAARSLGFRHGLTLRLIVIPQALRVIVPPLTSQYLNLTKNSSLAAAIAYPELVSVFAGTVLNQTGQAVETIAITMACYLSLSLMISMFMNWYNARIALKER